MKAQAAACPRPCVEVALGLCRMDFFLPFRNLPWGKRPGDELDAEEGSETVAWLTGDLVVSSPRCFPFSLFVLALDSLPQAVG